MSHNPLVSVIIVNYKGVNDTLECIDSVKQTDYPNFEIVVVENGSHDGSIEKLQQIEGIRLIANEKNLGAAGGRKAGILNSHGKYIVSLDNDVVVDPDWLKPMVEIMESDLSIGICIGSVHFYEERKKRKAIEEKIKTLHSGNMTILGYPGRFGTLASYEEVGINVSGGSACMFLKDRFGEFLPDYYFIGYEDFFLGWLSTLWGFKNRRCVKTYVWHKPGGVRTRKDIRHRLLYNDERNRLLNLLYFYERRTLLLILPLLLMDEIKKLLAALFIKSWIDPPYIYAYFASRLWLFFHISFIVKQRKHIQSTRKVPDFKICPFLDKRMYQADDFINGLFNAFSLFYCRKAGIS